jgi:hypothetical protein
VPDEPNKDSKGRPTRFFLTQVFGSTVQIKILEILLKNLIEEQKESKLIWQNFSDVASEAKVAKSSGKRVLDILINKGIIEEKHIETHAQNPPRLVRLQADNPVVGELLFFFKKVRGFL